jgi:hypothetical protein
MKYKFLIAALIVPLMLYASVFAQSAISGTVIKNANLRSGPGTTYAIAGTVKQGQIVKIVGKNANGTWYQLAKNQWIFATLVKVTNSTPSSAPTATPTPKNPPPQNPPVQPGTPKVVIQNVFYDGGVYQVESDEYAVIANMGTAPLNIGGWLLNAGDNGQNFIFPSFTIAPGQSVRVYTDEIHAETGGFSFNIHRAIWNNKGDCGYLYDKSAVEVSRYCY